MSINIEQYERIVRFLQEKMTGEERAAFLNEVAVNKELHEELEWERVLSNKDDISDEMDEWIEYASVNIKPHKKLEGERVLSSKDDISGEVNKVTKKTNTLAENLTGKTKLRGLWDRHKQWLIAASVTGIIITGIIVLLVNRQANTHTIITKKPDKKIDTAHQRGKDTGNVLQEVNTDYELTYQKFYQKYQSPDDLPADLENVQLAYVQHDYSRVISEANDISQTRGQQNNEDKLVNMYAGLYKGIAYMELNKTPKAINAFEETIKKSPPARLHDELVWYSALCYLKEKKTDECIKLLNTLTGSGSKKKQALLLKKEIAVVK